jgi:quercetin dioxygenase-like cupin family protein
MYFINLDQCGRRELLPGVHITTTWGESIMMSFLDLEPLAVIPEHSHPQEQMGMVLEGSFQLTIGGESHTVCAGDVYLIPSNVLHSVTNGEGRARALDIFSPPREDYKFE